MTTDPGPKDVAAPVDRPHRYVLDPQPECRELPGPQFDFDCCFVRPDGMAALGGIAEAVHAAPHKKAAVFGHTDTVGDEHYNKALSEQRGRIAYAALTHDPQPWEERYKAENWGPRAIQIMLNALQAGERLVEDGLPGPRTSAVVKQFQQREGLVTDGIAGPVTRKALFLAYMRLSIARPVEAGRFIDIGGSKYMGCGEFNPFTEGMADAASRRVVVLLFTPVLIRKGLPCAIGNVGPCKSNLRGEHDSPVADDKAPHFRCKVYRGIAVRCPCGPAVELMHFRIQLHDDLYRPCGNLAYRLKLDSDSVVHGITDGNGWLRNAVPKGPQVVTVAYTPSGSAMEYELPVRLTDADPDSDDALLCHVFNMGFGRSENDDRRMLIRFQMERGLALTGSLDEPTRDAILRIIQGADDSMRREFED